MSDKKHKVFFLDINLLLDDPRAYEKFGAENTVVIPWAVFTEIDQTRKQIGDAGTAAMKLARNILEAGRGQNLSEGVTLPNGGKLIVTPQIKFTDKDPLPEGIELQGQDMNLLRSVVAARKRDTKKDTDYILVTNDPVLQIAANVCNVKYEERLADKVDIGDKFYKGYSIIDMSDPLLRDAAVKVMSMFISSNSERRERHLSLATIKEKLSSLEYGTLESEIKELAMNKFWVVCDEKTKNERKEKKAVDTDTIMRYDHSKQAFVGVTTYKGEKILNCEAKNLEQQLAFELGAHLSDRTSQYAIVGETGTGKTYTWLLLALHNVLAARTRETDPNPYAKVYFTKPNLPLGGARDQKGPVDYGGFLANYFKIAKAAGIETQCGKTLIEAIEDENGIIEMKHIENVRGETFQEDDWFLVDESQNVTLRTMIELATRGGHFVAMGNIKRPDNPLVRIDSNGLVHAVAAVQRAKSIGKPYYLQAALKLKDRVRHPAVDYVLDCYRPPDIKPRTSTP